MTFEIPKPMKVEHDALHADLVKATRAGGETGEAARAVAKVLHGHFLKEEEFALPPLGLLAALGRGEFEPAMAEVLALTDRLEAEMPTMLAEHKLIVVALERLIAAAKAENKPDVAAFAARLKLHAQAEEEVAYPATRLIGRYVKSRLAAAKAVA
ncbi:MAG TPA: hypothetical protein VFQ27_06395 [Xanthobacteraceae bacterium]|nr:hypothetical protein [Xanthobacteraceae bacterium]